MFRVKLNFCREDVRVAEGSEVRVEGPLYRAERDFRVQYGDIIELLTETAWRVH